MNYKTTLNEDDLKEMNLDKPKSTEAPASANTRVQLPSGRQWQITMRTEKVSDLINHIEELEKVLDNKGWMVPEWQQKPANATTAPAEACPKCGLPLKDFVAKGITHKKCTGGKWNPLTKQTEGCTYVKWSHPDQK